MIGADRLQQVGLLVLERVYLRVEPAHRRVPGYDRKEVHCLLVGRLDLREFAA